VPTYAYVCTECGHDFEIVQAISDDAMTTCPECGGRLRKVFHPVGVAFKGSGFYRTDSRTEKPKEAAAASATSGSDSGSSGSSSDGGTKAAPKESASSGKSAGKSSKSSDGGPTKPTGSSGASPSKKSDAGSS